MDSNAIETTSIHSQDADPDQISELEGIPVIPRNEQSTSPFTVNPIQTVVATTHLVPQLDDSPNIGKVPQLHAIRSSPSHDVPNMDCEATKFRHSPYSLNFPRSFNLRSEILQPLLNHELSIFGCAGYAGSWMRKRRDIHILFNPPIDTLLFRAPYGECSCEDLKQCTKWVNLEDVKHIALACYHPLSDTTGTVPRLHILPSLLFKFPNLETFYRIFLEIRHFTGEKLPQPSRYIGNRSRKPNWPYFHCESDARDYHRLKFSHVLNPAQFEPSNPGSTEVESIVSARASYKSIGLAIYEWATFTEVFENHQQINPKWKRPAYRIGHLTINGVPWCRSYKETIEEIIERETSSWRGRYRICVNRLRSWLHS
ncbi:hypothetical protein HYALB_00010023 [Hymenoscyphus albidus]|uniref:Uncharacterized protein n=1 Tax=Hymenoscyphus albidus TaxID=595503 RepID=A0A9N9Q5R3_9HELO|nr:hypothetical protein HYALB_00010023 [Hymenoscyphus albidus]